VRSPATAEAARDPVRRGTNSEAAMTMRKPKPTLQSTVELPSEQLRLMHITVDPKPQGHDQQVTRGVGLPATRVLPQRGKATLH
jgi:hypothetical protein